jgi:hypothetical protein
MAKSAGIEPLSLGIGVGLGVLVYGLVVYGWPLLSPYILTSRIGVQE